MATWVGKTADKRTFRPLCEREISEATCKVSLVRDNEFKPSLSVVHRSLRTQRGVRIQE